VFKNIQAKKKITMFKMAKESSMNGLRKATS